MNIENIRNKSLEIEELHKDLNKKVADEYKGKTALVICPHYNGQLYGSSHPKLKGKTFIINDTHIERGKIYFYCKDWDEALEYDQLKIKGGSDE